MRLREGCTGCKHQETTCRGHHPHPQGSKGHQGREESGLYHELAAGRAPVPNQDCVNNSVWWVNTGPVLPPPSSLPPPPHSPLPPLPQPGSLTDKPTLVLTANIVQEGCGCDPSPGAGEPIYQEISQNCSEINKDSGTIYTTISEKVSKENSVEKKYLSVPTDEAEVPKDEAKAPKDPKDPEDTGEIAEVEKQKSRPDIVYGIITAKQVARFIPCTQTSIVRN